LRVSKPSFLEEEVNVNIEREARRIARALRPPRCPKCKAKLYGLTYLELAWNKANFYIVEELGTLDYNCWDTFYTEKAEYRCPKCDELLFTTEREAEAFLRGG